jgi:hypothetical protein
MIELSSKPLDKLFITSKDWLNRCWHNLGPSEKDILAAFATMAKDNGSPDRRCAELDWAVMDD